MQCYLKCESTVKEGKMPSRTLVNVVGYGSFSWTLRIIVMIFVMLELSALGANGAPQQQQQQQKPTTKPPLDALHNSAAPLSQQNVQVILASIEERLRTLDGVWSRARSSLDSHIHHTTRKLEQLDTRLERLERSIVERLDTLSTRLQEEEHATCTRSTHALHAKFAAEHARIASEHAAYACTSIKGHFDVQAVADSAARAERWKSSGSKQTRNTKSLQAPFSNPSTNFQRTSNITADQPLATQVEARLRKLEEATNGRRPYLMQQDAASAEELRAALAREASNIGSKLSNMYNELWRRSQSLESLVKDSMTIANATRRESQDGLRSVMMQLNRRGVQVQIPQQQSQECNIDQGINRVTSFVQRKMADTNSKMEKEFKKVLLAQNLFLDSCHRIQLNEPHFEAEVTAILDKLLDSFTNKTVTTFNELQLIQQLVKSHDSHIIKAVARVNNAALMCSKNQKILSENLDELKETYKESPQQNINKETVAILEDKIDGVMTILQELQEQFTYTESQENEIGLINENNSILDNIGIEVQRAVKNLSAENNSLFCPIETHNKNAELMEKLVHVMQNLQDSIENLEEKHILDKYNTSENDDDGYLEPLNQSMSNMITPNDLIAKLKKINFEDSMENGQDEVNEVQDEQKSPISHHSKKASTIKENNHQKQFARTTDHQKHHIRHGRIPAHKLYKKNEKPIFTTSVEKDISTEENDDFDYDNDYENDDNKQ